jgi:hypothetical protein
MDVAPVELEYFPAEQAMAESVVGQYNPEGQATEVEEPLGQ